MLMLWSSVKQPMEAQTELQIQAYREYAGMVNAPLEMQQEFARLY